MNWTLSRRVDLAGGGIKVDDASRQTRTAEELLQRFADRPGQILADEVGMGKTYVALAVAVSALEATERKRPVVIMVPPAVQAKWPKDWAVFQNLCLKPGHDLRATPATVRRGSDFLKLLDDPAESANHIIFLSHGALTSSLSDPFIRLALVRRALARPSLRSQRKAFPRWANRILRSSQLTEDLAHALMDAPVNTWARVYEKETGKQLDDGDDPVPQGLASALKHIDLSDLVSSLYDLPLRTGPNLKRRLSQVRAPLQDALQTVWRDCLATIGKRSPLLILDEAHHAKNPWTSLARLFENPDTDLIPALAGAFDRMLFLTATPFQLGHDELVEVLQRFTAVRWNGLDRAGYDAYLTELQEALTVAQSAALRLDASWGRLSRHDVENAPPEWWLHETQPSENLSLVAKRYGEARTRARAAEALLRHMVIRHIRGEKDERRHVYCGAAITDEHDKGGLAISDAALLPFLLAARTQAIVAREARSGGRRERAYFAEGLASSFEAYRHTRSGDDVPLLDDSASTDGQAEPTDELAWYLRQIDRALPVRDARVLGNHPKIAATVNRAVEIWLSDEKVLIFCFYIQTGRALRAHVSRAIRAELMKMAAMKLGCDPDDEETIERAVELARERLADADAPAARRAAELVNGLFAAAGMDGEERDRAVATVLPFLRTPSFLIRRFDLSATDRADAFEAALEGSDASGQTVGNRLQAFAADLAGRVPIERASILAALDTMPTRRIGVEDRSQMPDVEGGAAREGILPNVRLANGQVARAARERLMLGFNTPFFPEVLVASSVMAEGVDLQRSCRHVIHHDLDWNPSVIEQRTGRVDRLGSKAEVSGLPILVFEPYLEGTQDEKQFRVMKDRERWFNVVMGERLELDEASTDRQELRAPFPADAADALAMNLELIPRRRSGAG